VSHLFEVDPDRPEEAAEGIEAAARALAEGDLVIFPTDTVYAIASRPDSADATARLFEAKRRPAGLTLPVLVLAPHMAWRYGRRTDTAGALAARFWPGPLTLILRRTKESESWELGEETGSIGIRVPGHPISGSLLQRSGALAATSANLSGQPPLADTADLRATFGATVAVFLVLAPGAATPAGTSSTVIDLTGDHIKVLRRGPIDPDAVARGAREKPNG
jgi:tRNA threonylcarbamoyl adenosine modification protein (Sua5/YciO/YrdC/YwlC family)